MALRCVARIGRNKMVNWLEVVEIETNEVVTRVNVSGRGKASIYKVLSGMLRNMDTDRFFVREAE
jgi:ABC-type nitrate/sulfonate/bicarbonate transport system ATPase subunit